MAEKNQKIAAQLRTLATNMEQMADSELLLTILDACNGLMLEVQNRRLAVADMDDIDRIGYVAGYSGVSELVGKFAADMQNFDRSDWDENKLKDTMAELEKQRRKDAELKNAIATAQAQHDAQKNANDKQEEELKKLRDFYATLLEMSKQCTPEIIEQQKRDNADLMADYTARNNELNDLLKEHQEKKKDLEEAQRSIQGAKDAIAAIPEENHRLLAQYDDLCNLLQRLENIKEECSPEVQGKLKEKIEELRPQAEELGNRKDELQGIYNRLVSAKTELSQNKQELETNVLEVIGNSLGELTRLMEEHREELVRIRTEAETYAQGLEECRKLKEGCEGWLGTARENLEAMLEAIGHDENMNLRAQLNLNDHKTIQDLFENASTSLREVDRILGRCKDAAARDRKEIERLAGKR